MIGCESGQPFNIRRCGADNRPVEWSRQSVPGLKGAKGISLNGRSFQKIEVQ